ncbi:hypothetical protein ACFL0C_00805 [Patescibacteria group bacterium]
MKYFKQEYLLALLIFILVTVGVGINVYKQLSIDQSKLPDKVEESKGFQRWITNLKNKELDFVNADQFRLLEENEIYNTKWLNIYSIDEPGMMDKYNEEIESHKKIDKVIFSPSERLYLDYRNEKRGDYEPNEAHFYGIRDDKIIDARILDCSTRANCYFDRAYFLSNDLFVISEFSRNIHKKDTKTPTCPVDQECEYSIKIHVIDLINNSRLVYISKPFNIVLSDLIPEL